MNRDIKILNDNSVYRLSDIFFAANDIDVQPLMSSDEYKDTILVEYINKKQKFRDWQTLASICSDRIASGEYKQPSSDELVLHIRLGDIFISGKTWMIDESTKYFEKLITNISKWTQKYPNQSRVTCVTAHHFGHWCHDMFVQDALAQADNILTRIEDECNKINKPVSYKSSSCFDHDFLYMVGADTYIPGYQQGHHKSEKLGTRLGISTIVQQIHKLIYK